MPLIRSYRDGLLPVSGRCGPQRRGRWIPLEVLREIAVRDRSADRHGTAAQQLRGDGGDALALVGGSGSGRVVDGDVALSGHVAGSVGISIDELDRVGVSGGDDEATEGF